MSGPVTSADIPAEPRRAAPRAYVLEITQSRESRVGAITVRRALPRRGRRTVGPWCFVDHMGPALVSAPRGMDVAPHPHIGLQTVPGSWRARRCTVTRSAASRSSCPASST